MQQNEQKKKKGSPLATIFFVILFLIFAASDELPEDAFVGLIGLAITVGVVFVIAKAATANAPKEDSHTHDRIDHSRDLQINPRTGKVSTPTRYTVHPHSAREHWKQQLDGLLANGTIDRDEYAALLNRRF